MEFWEISEILSHLQLIEIDNAEDVFLFSHLIAFIQMQLTIEISVVNSELGTERKRMYRVTRLHLHCWTKRDTASCPYGDCFLTPLIRTAPACHRPGRPAKK